MYNAELIHLRALPAVRGARHASARGRVLWGKLCHVATVSKSAHSLLHLHTHTTLYHSNRAYSPGTAMTTYIPSITLPGFMFENAATAILAPVAAGTAIGFSTRPRQTQKTYLALRQPPLRPPPQIFGPMWTMLYGLMGYAAYRAWSTGVNSFDPRKVQLAKVSTAGVRRAWWARLTNSLQQGATLYTIQLALNLIWMPLFFRFKRPIEATIDIVALTGITGYLTYIWGQVDEVAGYALIPYLGWLSFATYLSAGAGYLNNWDFSSKEIPKDMKSQKTKYVDEKP